MTKRLPITVYLTPISAILLKDRTPLEPNTTLITTILPKEINISPIWLTNEIKKIKIINLTVKLMLRNK